MTLNVDRDAFSNGQIGSKLWLCEELEKLFDSIDQIWIYGGWYGISAFLLRSRNNIKIERIKSFDLDPSCESVADMINEHWVYQEWQFKAATADCNTLNPIDADLIINTSTEHFDSLDWWINIPDGKIVAIQGNDMAHEDHCRHFESIDSFHDTFRFSEVLFSGQKEFVYPSWKFTRFMIIGKK